MLPEVIKRLITLTNDNVRDVKIAAIQALGESAEPAPEIIDRLLLLSNDVVKEVKVAATLALGRINRQL
jgi:HEAT repeat protein